jgi:Ala-tRNA(Pro) deacylase
MEQTTDGRRDMAATALIEALDERQAEYELIPHQHTETARAEARALGVRPEETAKTVIVRTPDRFVRAVVPASAHVDLERLGAILGVDELAVATEAELVGAYPSFELGAVPPFDSSFADFVVIDKHLCEAERVAFDAGTHEESIRMRTADLIELSRATLAEICDRDRWGRETP